MEKRKNKSDGERTYPMMGRVPSRTLQVGRRREEIVGELFGSLPTGREKINNGVKAYSGSRLIQPNLVPWTCLMDGSDMSDGLRLDNLS
jgi:hypothetical protein